MKSTLKAYLLSKSVVVDVDSMGDVNHILGIGRGLWYSSDTERSVASS